MLIDTFTYKNVDFSIYADKSKKRFNITTRFDKNVNVSLSNEALIQWAINLPSFSSVAKFIFEGKNYSIYHSSKYNCYFAYRLDNSNSFNMREVVKAWQESCKKNTMPDTNNTVEVHCPICTGNEILLEIGSKCILCKGTTTIFAKPVEKELDKTNIDNVKLPNNLTLRKTNKEFYASFIKEDTLDIIKYTIRGIEGWTVKEYLSTDEIVAKNERYGISVDIQIGYYLIYSDMYLMCVSKDFLIKNYEIVIDGKFVNLTESSS